MTGRKIAVPGFKLDKHNRVVRNDERRLSVSQRIQRRASKRVKVVRWVAR
jgi:hypothetical protein